MLPLKLDIENFYCHSKSIIDFNDFSAAVIVGRINGNDKFSNGAGKSTIFAAIKYVLFNEVDTSSLEKVIKHDSDSCKVLFEFISSLDNHTYKIIRFRGRKPGAEVRLFRRVGDDWEDLTQRTPTETDREIVKLIKINYRTFSNSVLFAQGDMSGIAAMTPRERKTALKEALQLGIYSKYEKAIKNKVAELTKEVEKTQTIISTLGNPEMDIIELAKNLENIKPIKEEIRVTLEVADNNLNILTEDLITKQKNLKDLSDQIVEANKSLVEIERDISVCTFEIRKYQSKIIDLGAQEQKSFNRAKQLALEIKALKKPRIRTEEQLKELVEFNRNLLADQQLTFNQLIAKYKDLSVPLTEETICKHCRQRVDPEARALCQASIDSELKEIDIEVIKLQKSLPIIKEKLFAFEKEQEDIRKSSSILKEKEFELEKEKKNTISSASILVEFKELKNTKETELKSKEIIKSELAKRQEGSFLKNQENKLNTELYNIRNRLNILTQERRYNLDKISALSNEEAVLLHKIEQKNKDKEKISNLKQDLVQLEYRFALHQKVLTAFGPSGIPALITHTILDDYQVESNNVLDKLRPSLRLQFLTEDERSDGEMADTLEITYFLNNTELEFSQLSGAQKLLVSLALRLGLAAVISKRLGIDLKMILIDEADQSLDEAALETFEQAIKELQKDYKILIITHNQNLKEKFQHAIVVEQDNNLCSTAKVSNGW